jgi:hypothetical protein
MVCLGVNSGRHALVAAPILAQEEAKLKAAHAEALQQRALAKAKPRDFDPMKLPAADPSLERSEAKKPPTKPTKPEELRPSERLEPSPAAPELGAPAALVWTMDAAYWLLPKPLDFGYLVYDNIRAAALVEAPPYYEVVVGRKLLDLRWSVLSSLAFAILMFAAAAQQFSQDDY